VFIHLIIKQDKEEENNIVHRLGFNMKFPTTVWHAVRNAIKYVGHDPSAFTITAIRLFDYDKKQANPIQPENVSMEQPSAIPLRIEVDVEKSMQVSFQCT
jgi:hypothetical protein